MAHPKLIEDPSGMIFEYLDEEEAEFLYEEVFVRHSYLRHGLVVDNGAVVIDAGANIGLFSLQCLREAKRVKVYAFEPIPDIYSVLVRNLHTSVSSVETGAGPRPVALRVALGAEQGEGEFHFFGGSPGESTRYPEEREKQRRTLLADPEATSWRHALEPPRTPQQTNKNAADALGGKPAPPALVAPVDGSKRDDCSAISKAAAAVVEVEEEAEGKSLRSPAADLDINVSVASNNASPFPGCSAETSASVCPAAAAAAVPMTASRTAAGGGCAGGTESNLEKSEEGCNKDGEREGPRKEEEATESEDCDVLEAGNEEED
ncbi:unnamed protein product, partial [Laminaria digitata]